MATITTTIYINHGETEYACAVEVVGTVTYGGSNSYGSDDPEWTEVEDVTVYNARGNRVTQRFLDRIESKTWDYLYDLLVEADSSW